MRGQYDESNQINKIDVFSSDVERLNIQMSCSTLLDLICPTGYMKVQNFDASTSAIRSVFGSY